MAIKFRHDAAAVALPSVSEGSRKYGQQMVLQEQQRKYQAQQAGFDRLFQLGRDQMQNQNQFVADVRRNTFQERRDKAQHDFTLKQEEAKRQQAFMDDARKQSSGVIMDDIKNGEYDPATSRKLQQNLVAESEALGNPGLDATQRAEALAKIRAERTMLTANRLQKPPPPTREEELQKFLGPNYEQYKDQPWVPDGKGGFAIAKDALLKQQKEQEQQQKAEEEAKKMRPKSFQDYYGENEDKFQKDLNATKQSLQKTNPDTGAVTDATPEEALEQMQKDYDFRQKALGKPQYGTPTDAPALPGAAPSGAAPSFAPGSMLGDQASALGMNPSRSILEAPPKDYSAQNRVSELLGQRPVDPNAPAPVPRGAPPMPAPAAGGADQPPATQWDSMSFDEKIEAYYRGVGEGDIKEEARANIRAKGEKVLDDLARMDAEGRGFGKPSEELKSLFNPQGAPQPAETATAARAPATSRFTPPGLSPQEAEARQQMLDMPMDQRVTSLMPHSSDPLLAGKTIDQALADPEVRKIYDEEIAADAKKRGVKPPAYREAMLAVFDEALTGEILNGGVSMPQQNYAGMHVDDIKDPKAKAEVDKIPRPKSPGEIASIRGPYFVGEDGIIRSTKKL